MQELNPQNEQNHQKAQNKTPITEFLSGINERRCPVCFSDFDTKKRVPMMVCSSQHSICRKCLKNIVKTQIHTVRVCPLCKQTMRNKMVKKNRLLFQLIHKIKSTQAFLLKQEEISVQQNSQKDDSRQSHSEASGSDEQIQVENNHMRSGIAIRMQRRMWDLQRTVQSLYGNIDRIRVVDADGGNERRYSLMREQQNAQIISSQPIRQVSITRRPFNPIALPSVPSVNFSLNNESNYFAPISVRPIASQWQIQNLVSPIIRVHESSDDEMPQQAPRTLMAQSGPRITAPSALAVSRMNQVFQRIARITAPVARGTRTRRAPIIIRDSDSSESVQDRTRRYAQVLQNPPVPNAIRRVSTRRLPIPQSRQSQIQTQSRRQRHRQIQIQRQRGNSFYQNRERSNSQNRQRQQRFQRRIQLRQNNTRNTEHLNRRRRNQNQSQTQNQTRNQRRSNHNQNQNQTRVRTRSQSINTSTRNANGRKRRNVN